MIKSFTLNDNNKIEMSKEELKELLDEIYWEGYHAHPHSWTYTTPYWTNASPNWISCNDSSLTVSTTPLNSITTNTAQIDAES